MICIYMQPKKTCFIHSICRHSRAGAYAVPFKNEQNKHCSFITGLDETTCLDRNRVGSGNDLIRGNKKADIQMQQRIKF